MVLENLRQKRLIKKILVRKAVHKGKILFIKSKLGWVIFFNILSTNVGDQNVKLHIFFSR